jgi:hypothetical protein
MSQNPRESRRQAGRYAPTWSWASVTGLISYIDEVNEEHRSETRLESKLDLLNSIIILDTKNAYGSGYGKLTVGGRFLHLPKGPNTSSTFSMQEH